MLRFWHKVRMLPIIRKTEKSHNAVKINFTESRKRLASLKPLR